MASEIAFKAFEGLPPGSSVLDPMCGSGVVVRRALDRGHLASGLDIDPLAILMAKIWTAQISSSVQDSFGLELVQSAKKLMGTHIELPWIDGCQETGKFIDFWFHKTQQRQMRALLSASSHLKGQRANLAKLALSRLVITKSRGASLAADVSHSRPHRVREINDFDIWVEFPKSFARILNIMRNSPPQTGGKIRRGDARKLRGVKSASIDAIVTSPPYFNAIDYLRGHRLALVWLGYSIKDLREVKSQGIGAFPGKIGCQDSLHVNRIVELASQQDMPAKVEITVRKYIYDILACFKQTARVLRIGGYAVYVVSNSVLSGIVVDTANIIIEAASLAGLRLESRYARDIPREHRYLPPPQSTSNLQLATRMRTESVLRFSRI